MVRYFSKRLLQFSFFILFLYLLFGWIFTQTIYEDKTKDYVANIVLFFMFFLCVTINNSERYRIETTSTVWLPFLLYSLVLYIGALLPIRIIFYSISIFLLILSVNRRISGVIPFYILLFGGIYALGGILVQFFLPDFYLSNISSLFKNADMVELWGDSYGLAGFTCQPDITARMLILFEGSWLFVYNRIKKNNGVLYWIVLIIIILGIFLTGKRTTSFISVLIPFLIYYISQNNRDTRILYLFIMTIIGVVCFMLFLSYVGSLSENIFLRRFVLTLERVQSGQSISSGRDILWEKAYDAFWTHPLFGIGVDQYHVYSGMGTEVHNAYLQILCEQGIVGFVMYIIPLVTCIILTVRTIKLLSKNSIEFRYCQFSLYYQFYYIANSFTGNPTTSAITFIMYFISVSILSDIRYRMVHNQLSDRTEIIGVV